MPQTPTEVYVVAVTASPGPGTVIRWLLLLCLLTAATVGVVGVGFEAAGRPFPAASAYWVAVFSFALGAVPSAWLVRSRYAGLPAGPTDRLRGLRVPAVPPRRPGDEAEVAGLDPADCPGAAIRIEGTAHALPAAGVRLSGPLPAPPSSGAEVRPTRGEASSRAPGTHQSPPATPRDQSTDGGLPAAVRVEPESVEDPGLPAVRVETGRVPGAKELAEVLNLYDRIGLAPDGGSAAAATVPYRVEAAPGERTLWRELVEEFGAESIDFRGDGAGECWITLSTGELVFYDPDHQSWMWVVFESEEDAPPYLDEAPAVVRIVVEQP